MATLRSHSLWTYSLLLYHCLTYSNYLLPDYPSYPYCLLLNSSCLDYLNRYLCFYLLRLLSYLNFLLLYFSLLYVMNSLCFCVFCFKRSRSLRFFRRSSQASTLRRSFRFSVRITFYGVISLGVLELDVLWNPLSCYVSSESLRTEQSRLYLASL